MYYSLSDAYFLGIDRGALYLVSCVSANYDIAMGDRIALFDSIEKSAKLMKLQP